jgi:hypothetical protein
MNKKNNAFNGGYNAGFRQLGSMLNFLRWYRFCKLKTNPKVGATSSAIQTRGDFFVDIEVKLEVFRQKS